MMSLGLERVLHRKRARLGNLALLLLPYEKDEQETLVTAFTEEIKGRLRLRYGWGCVLILETGLRAGEALGLEWGDIDEENAH